MILNVLAVLILVAASVAFIVATMAKVGWTTLLATAATAVLVVWAIHRVAHWLVR